MAQKDSKQTICYVTGEVYPKATMLKFVISPDNFWCFDFKQKLPGKSVFIKNSCKIAEQFLEKILYQTSPECIIVSSNLASEIENAYIKQMLSVISLAKKSGSLVLGKEKIKIALNRQKDGIIIQSLDASLREKFKNTNIIIVDRIFSAEQLSKACGKENVTYILILNQFIAIFKECYNKYCSYLNS